MPRNLKPSDEGRGPKGSKSFGNRNREAPDDRELDLDDDFLEDDDLVSPARKGPEPEPERGKGADAESEEEVIPPEGEPVLASKKEETGKPQLELKHLLFGWMKNLKLIEKICLGLVGLFFLVAFLYIRSLLGPSEAPISEKDLFAVNLPAAGKMVTITEVDRYWRRKTEADKTAADQAVIPEIAVRHSGEGFLRFLFQGPEGSIRGDGFTVAVSDAPNPLKVYSTEGYESVLKLESHQESSESPWSILLLECNEEKASFSNWNQIAEIKIPPTLSKDKTP